MTEASAMSCAATPKPSYVEAVTPKDDSAAYSPLHHHEERIKDVTAISATGHTASTAVGSTNEGVTTTTPVKMQSVPLRSLFRYASIVDRVLLAVGAIMVILNGALYPCMAILFGEAISSFQPVDMAKLERVALLYFVIAVALFATDYIAHVCLETTAQRQVHALRIHVFRHVMDQSISWFDSPSTGFSVSTLNGTTLKIKDGIGIKLGEVLRCLASFITGYTIGFVRHWRVSIVMAAVMPFMALSLSYVIKTLRARAVFSHQKYAQAGAMAEETLRSIRTVVALNGQQHALDQYLHKATSAEAENIKLARVLSMVLGFFFGMIWVTYAVGLWYGASVVANGGETDPRTVFTAFYGILIGTISLAQLSPNVAAVVTAKAVAASLYSILSTSPVKRAGSELELVPSATCDGLIEFKNVEFAYPSRPDTLVLRNFSLRIEAGETVAFVGPSGGGKSTVVALLQRFYEPDAGQITVDGHEIHALSLRWLRRQIGIVSQEPVLFTGSIFDNIALAVSPIDDGEERLGHEELRERVQLATRHAHAHEFIMALPQGYDTQVGGHGIALSGGQKQRIAIARALVRRPRVLILDEATSALDTESEAQIQAALDAIILDHQRTTLVIAHRLSTIRNADRVCVVQLGEIVESGGHEELVRKENGVFQEMVIKAMYASGGDLSQRNASLVWHDSLSELLGSGRESSVAMLMGGLSVTALGSSVSLPINEGYPQLVPTAGSTNSLFASDCQTPTPTDSASTQTPTKKEPEASNQPPASSQSVLRVVRRLVALNRPERLLFVLGLVAATINGLSFPASAVLLSAIVSSMVTNYGLFIATNDQRHLDQLYDHVWQYCVVYFAGAVALAIITFLQSYAFKLMGEKLVTRLRRLHFHALIAQDMAVFDDPQRSGGSGAMASELATMATKASILGGDTIGRLTQAVATFVAALLVSFLIGSWLLSLIMCAVFPVLIASQLVRTKTLKGTDANKGGESEVGANSLASEAVTNIRTVAALGLEKKLVDDYRQLSLAPLQTTARAAHCNGIVLGFSSFTTFAAYALVFWYGGRLVASGSISFAELMRSLMAIMISATGIGQAASHLTEVDEALYAARRILAMHVPSQTNSDANELVPPEGTIEFKEVTFAYPTRPNAPVLRGFSLRIEPGQIVALCGPSGGGKSTVIALLERFYDPTRGRITVGGVDLHALNKAQWRAQIGLISQEPVLFAGSIRDNIAYSLATTITTDQVEHAARVANAHDFISSFPDGYDTVISDVGGAGVQLSGGQKQRIAIARAVLRDPAIFLLDEATSALDTDSEQRVQEALETLLQQNSTNGKTRTTLVVAHRMRTIRHADQICVVDHGRVVEQGSHHQLLQRNGLYARLVHNAEDQRFSMVE